MNRTLTMKKQEQSNSEISGFDTSITEFSSIMVELFCVQINRQLTLQLNHENCMGDVTNFLKDQKIIGKNTEVNYSLPNNPKPVNSLWTLKQIMATFDLRFQEKLIFTVQVSEENHDYGRFQKRKEVCCKCEIF